MLRVILCAWTAAAAVTAQTVEVRVINAATGAGIPYVSLRFLQYGQTVYTGATDPSGLFRIEAAKEGPYTALFNAPKFSPVSGGPNVTFQVAAGANPVRVDIEMYPLSRISGRVLDADGKPVAKARIDLQNVSRFNGGGWTLDTDEKGAYSNEEISPGTWILAATAPPSLAPPESPADQPLGWAHTFYPSITDFQLAPKIVVSPGSELRDMDVRLAAVPVHHIRGVVLDMSGNPVPKASVTLDARQPPALHQESKSDGTFELAQVVDGECRLSTTINQEGVKLRASQWVQVKGRDLENIELRLVPPFSIQGKIVMEVPDGAPVPGSVPKIPGITLRSADMFGGFDEILPGIGFFAGDPVGDPNGQGGFTIRNLYPGPYYILPGAAPAPFYLDSIRIGARDALEPNTQILPTDLPLTVTYKLNGGAVRGTVELCGGGSVFLIPQDPAFRRDGFIRRASCAKDGRFEISAIRPGEYYGLAVAKDSPIGGASVGLDQSLINESLRITVRANEATLADLHLIAR